MVHEDNILGLIQGIEMIANGLNAKNNDPNLPVDKLTQEYFAGIKLLRFSLSQLEGEINALDEVWTRNAGLCYYVVINEYGHKYFHDCKTRTQCQELANSYCGDNGFAYVYTNDTTYPKRDRGSGDTLYFESVDDAFNAAKAEIPPRKRTPKKVSPED